MLIDEKNLMRKFQRLFYLEKTKVTQRKYYAAGTPQTARRVFRLKNF